MTTESYEGHGPQYLNRRIVKRKVRTALFDFDGTLSLIRAGWQNIMLPYFLDELLKTPHHGSPEAEQAVIRDFVETLTGKQTIYQCMRLAEEITCRGGKPRDPLYYKDEYLDLLWDSVGYRVAALKNGKMSTDDLLLSGSREFLQSLKEQGIALYLASGTDHRFVEDEAAALQVDDFFAPHIYGARDDFKSFSKQMVIDQILKNHHLEGDELLVVGDGYVEIENGKAVNGRALGVACDEELEGGWDEWKRDRLTRAGADALVCDYMNLAGIMQWIERGPIVM